MRDGERKSPKERRNKRERDGRWERGRNEEKPDSETETQRQSRAWVGEEGKVDSEAQRLPAGPLPPREDSWGGGGGPDSPPLCCSLNQHLRLLHPP